MYLVLKSDGETLSECVVALATTLEFAREIEHDMYMLGRGTTIHVLEISDATARKFSDAIELERELLETLRTGLSRRARGTR